MLRKPRKTFLAIPDLLKQAELRQKSSNQNVNLKDNKNSDIMTGNKASQLMAKSAKNRKSVPTVSTHSVSYSNSGNIRQYQKEQTDRKESSYTKNQGNKENCRTKENRFIVKKNRNVELIQPSYDKQANMVKNSPQNISMVSSHKKVKSESKMRFSHIHVLSQNYEQAQSSYHSSQNSQLSTHQIQSTSQIKQKSEIEAYERKNRYEQDQLDISNGIEQNLEMSCLQTQFEPKIIQQTKGQDQMFYNDEEQMSLLASMFSKSNMFIDSEKWKLFLKRTQDDEKFQKALKNFMYSYFIQHYQ